MEEPGRPQSTGLQELDDLATKPAGPGAGAPQLWPRSWGQLLPLEAERVLQLAAVPTAPHSLAN